MVPRCYVPDADASAERVRLPAGEAHHVRHVMRLGDGAAVRVFDGRGREWHARLADGGKAAVFAVLGEPALPAAEPPMHLTLAQALLKAEYMDDAVRDAAMVGVSAIQPIVTAHATIDLQGPRAARLVERWQRIAVASVKQCGRAILPRVDQPRTLTGWLASAAGDAALKLLLAEPAMRDAHATEPDLQAWRLRAREGGAIVLVGPEGGWTSHEMGEAREAGFVPWTVSPRTLRADAVSVVALSVLLYAWERPNTSATQSSSS